LILEETVNQILRHSINELFGENFAIRANEPNGVRPAGSYASVGFLTQTKNGLEHFKRVDQVGLPDIEQTVTTTNNMTYSLNFFRASAYDNARLFHAYIVTNRVQQFWDLIGIGLIERSAIRPIDQIIDGIMEQRAQFDLTVNVYSSESEIITAIESAKITGRMETTGGLIINTENNIL
jgi:hypothetical protein